MTAICKKLADGLTFKKILLILLGAMICTFGIHNIHQRTNITEGGVIGLMLLVEHWLKISPRGTSAPSRSRQVLPGRCGEENKKTGSESNRGPLT